MWSEDFVSLISERTAVDLNAGKNKQKLSEEGQGEGSRPWIWTFVGRGFGFPRRAPACAPQHRPWI